MSPDRITVIRQDSNRGQGIARNIAVEWADHHGSPFVLFQDSDDIANPRRLEVTRAVFDGGEADFVYSSFAVVDARGNAVPEELVAPSVREILEAHRDDPPQGKDCWITISTETGYLTLTSTVSVSTARALRNPFPDARGSEDGHAFLRMSADGAVFAYQPSIPAKYRIHADSISARLGRPLIWTGAAEHPGEENVYHATKLRVDSDGFEQACVLAAARGALSESDVPGLRAQFRQRITQTIDREGP
jgi:glycosyltransferase involved in cell wall biosynthesis